MKRQAIIHQLILKIVQRCNLNCTYCYMYNHVDQSFRGRPAFMDDTVFDAMLSRIQEYCAAKSGHKMGLLFHGGEPMLFKPNHLDALAQKARRRLGDSLSYLAMQSNGTMVSDEWIDVLKRNNIRIGISIDGPQDVHDLARVDHAGKGSHAATVAGLLRLQAAGLFASAICVVQPGQSGVRTYRHFREMGVNKMSFLFPDATHDSKDRLYGSFGETPVADFLVPIFDEWFAEDNPDCRILVFEDIIKRLLGGASVSDILGGGKPGYLVIDSDGTIGCTDVFKVCEEGMASSPLNVLTHGFEQFPEGSLWQKLTTEAIPLSSTCQACPERAICGGGDVPHRYSKERQFNNPSIWCKDLLALISHIRLAVQQCDHSMQLTQ